MGRKYIFWIMVIVWMMVIFKLSSDNKEASSYKSKQVTAIVQQLASKMSEDIKLVSPIGNITEHIVRKTGHILEYFLLTSLVIIASAISRRGKGRIIRNAVLIPLLFAISDELHQLYTPGRGPQITDVLIDGIGIVTAIGLSCVLFAMLSIYRSLQGERI